MSLSGLDEFIVFDSGSIESRLSPSSDTELDQVKKVPFFSWKRFKSISERFTSKNSLYGNRIHLHQPLTDSSRVDSVAAGLTQKVDATDPSKSQRQTKNHTAGNWEAMELTTRDGQTKLKAQVFFASLDQCSDKAAGESACTALVAVITPHWLQIKTRQNANRNIIRHSLSMVPPNGKSFATTRPL